MTILQIDRTIAFDLFASSCVGGDWSIAEQDERSLALSEVDLTKISFETMLKDGEKTVDGEERLKRLKNAKHIRLDANVFQTLWRNQHLIPASWKERTNGNTTYVFFDGTIFRESMIGDSGVLYLCWNGGGWLWSCHWLYLKWRAHNPSAVLAS